jgi:lipopolysaccharide export system protein LptA
MKQFERLSKENRKPAIFSVTARPFFRTAACFLVTLTLSAASAAAQHQETPADTATVRKVYLERADRQLFDRNISADRQVFTGNVSFRHDSAWMYCDSAWLYEQSSRLEAFGSVCMEQGDTLFLRGDYLFYDGVTQVAQLRHNVVMINIQSDTSVVTLFTDSLDFNRIENIGYYFDGGQIIDSENVLTSVFGQYSPGTKTSVFNDSVTLVNSGFTLCSDTLHYNTVTKVADILGPSVIVSDSGTVHTSRGWYSTADNVSLLLDRSEIVSGDRVLTGDSITYDRDNGVGQAFGNIILRDTANKIILDGQYGYYNEKTEFAFVTDSARCMEYSQGDTLYLHADTLEMTTDSAVRTVKAWHGVRFFRVDLQGVCDSMQFNTRDSVLHMYTDPILWNGQYQLTGDTIHIYMRDSTVDHVHVSGYAFAIEELDSAAYNQLKGNRLDAFFEGRAVRQIDIDGSAESIFYPIEEDGNMVGMNETRSSYLSIRINNGKLERLKIWPKPQGTMTPLPDLLPEQRRLKDFYWYDYLRPSDPSDVFRASTRRTEDVPPKRSGRFR